MATSKVHVSPGVYTKETDLTFVTRQVGVTTLGMAGETTKGPAFQPIFVSDYNEFMDYFGGLNTERFKDTGFQKYELPYNAKSFLSQTNQLYVTRVLGLSGFHAGEAWTIKLEGAADPDTELMTAGPTTAPALFSYGLAAPFPPGTISGLTSSDTILNGLIQDGNSNVLDIVSAAIYGGQGTTFNSDITGDGNADIIWGEGVNGLFTGVKFDDCEVLNTGTTGMEISGIVETWTASAYTETEGKVIAVVRSRGGYYGQEYPTYDVQQGTMEIVNASGTNFNIDSNFNLIGTDLLSNDFDYEVSLDRTKRNYLPNVLGRTEKDSKTPMYLESFYEAMLDRYIDNGMVSGISGELTEYIDTFDDYITTFNSAVSPWTLSERQGNTVKRLFRLHTISDGNHANKEVKFSIQNIKLDDNTFDVVVRKYSDTDARPYILERFSSCDMQPKSPNFIGRRIGTIDGNFPTKSKFALVEMFDQDATVGTIPSGFLGVPVKDFSVDGNLTDILQPTLTYKVDFDEFVNKRKQYLGLSETIGIDQDFFDFQGVNTNTNPFQYTDGFHMDMNATGVTFDGETELLDLQVGPAPFETELGVIGTDYEKIYARKFTFAPYGGFDAWDIFRDKRTNNDGYTFNGTKGRSGVSMGVFREYPLTNGDDGITSDYYAYLEAIRTFNNPEAVNINVFTTPGINIIDQSNLTEDTIEMIEDKRRDSLYIANLKDFENGEILTCEDVTNRLADTGIDSSYTATYWPWTQINDVENNEYVWIPPTRDVVRNIALTDNISFPWFATAGIQRGDVKSIQVRKKVTEEQRDILYGSRINPLAYFASEGIKIWGNKTLQLDQGSALSRINVRRLLLQTRKLISAVAIRLLFDQNDEVVRNQFTTLINPILNNIRSQRGLVDYRVQLDNSPESYDRNELNGKIFLKPTRTLEFINIEFVLTNTGASFDDI